MSAGYGTVHGVSAAWLLTRLTVEPVLKCDVFAHRASAKIVASPVGKLVSFEEAEMVIQRLERRVQELENE